MADKSFHHASAASSCMDKSAFALQDFAIFSEQPMRFVAAEAGFFPPGPLTFFADMVGNSNHSWLSIVIGGSQNQEYRAP